MKAIFKLSIIFLAVILLVSCEKESDPESIYKDYLTSIQAMKSMSENGYQRFISARAKAVVEEKISGIKENQLDQFLTVFKAEAVIPEGSQINLDSKSQEKAIMKVVAKGYPEEGSMHQQNVRFVQEDGWKIDKIEVITSGNDFEFKSITY